jgi:hypothetical protein
MEVLTAQRTNIFNQMKDAKIKNDFEAYIKYQDEYKRMTAKIYHEKNKETEKYKMRKYNNVKKYLENPENYEKHKNIVKERNKIIYNEVKKRI